MEIKGTEGTGIIKHDWGRIKNSTDRYRITEMRVKVFRYKIIEEGTNEIPINSSKLKLKD